MKTGATITTVGTTPTAAKTVVGATTGTAAGTTTTEVMTVLAATMAQEATTTACATGGTIAGITVPSTNEEIVEGKRRTAGMATTPTEGIGKMPAGSASFENASTA